MKISLWSIGVIGLFATSAMAFNPADVDWNSPADDVFVEGKPFEGTFSKVDRWDGVLCNGGFAVSARLKGVVEKLDLNLREDGTLAAFGRVNQVKAVLAGSYKSDLSLCTTLGLSHKITADAAEAVATVSFKDNGENALPDIKVNITRATLYELRVFNFLPDFLNDMITDFANDTLKSVWRTRLGEIINQKVSQFIKDKLPPPAAE